MTSNFITKVINNLVATRDKKFFWVFLAVFYILCRLPVWLYPIDSDHWIFALIGHEWLSGKGILYVDFWDHKPPVIFLINGLISFFVGSNIWLFRFVLTLFNLVEIYLFYTLVKKLSQDYLKKLKNYPLLITGLYTIIRNFSQIASSGNNTENFGVILVIISYIQLINFYGATSKVKFKPILFIGICFALVFWLKANMLLLYLPLFGAVIYELYTIWLRTKKIKIQELFTILLVLFTPWIILSLGIVAYFASLGHFLDLWIGSFGFSAKYVQAGFKGALSDTRTFLLILLPLFLTLILPTFNWVVRLKNNTLNKIELVIFFGGLISLFYLGISGTYYPYYVLICLPVFLIFVVVGHLNLSGIFRKLSTIIIILGLLTSSLISYKQPLNFFYGENANLQNEYYQIADYIKTNTSTTDRIFTYVYGASLYGLSERQSSTKYLSASFMLLDYREKLGFGINQSVIEDLKSEKKPRLIVMYKDKNPKTSLYATNTPIQDYLIKNYPRVEKEFETLEIRSNITFGK